jgi:hypothetical protein
MGNRAGSIDRFINFWVFVVLIPFAGLIIYSGLILIKTGRLPR